jgi:hypothetical protein
VELPVVNENDVLSPPKGNILNVETLFPEWNIDGENWTEMDETKQEPSAPGHLGATSIQRLKEFLLLEDDETANDPKKAGKASAKKEPPKKGKEPSTEFSDLAVDEAGKPLPRVYIKKSPAETARDPLLSRFQTAPTSEPSVEIGDGGSRPFSPHRQTQHRQTLLYDGVVDPLMCAVFTLIDRFAPAIVSKCAETDSNSFPFLWNAVYPQSPSGVPCYNPAGKYCVKLFIAGKWRKVCVKDTVFVRSDGLSAYASSIDPLELWPMLLSKAVYAIFGACGYSDIIVDPCAPCAVGVGGEVKPAALTSASFVGFAVHVLTGWQPGTCWDISDLINLDFSRANLLLQEILFGGAALISPADIPKEIPKPTIIFNNNATIESTNLNSGADGTESAGGTLMLTKKLFKAEYRRRQNEKASILESIMIREAMIRRIQDSLDKPFAESFFVCIPQNDGTIETSPVLGLSYEAKHDGNPGDLDAVQLLLKWRITGSQFDTVTPTLYTGDPAFNPAQDDIKDPKLSEVGKPLPPSTTVDFKFVSVAELRQKGAVFLGLDTLLRHNSKVSMSWHWKPVAPLQEKDSNTKVAKGGPSKGAKKGDGIAVTTETDLLCQDAGNMAPAVVAVMGEQFFTEITDNGFADGDRADELARPGSRARNDGLLPKASHLSMSVLIHADMVRLKADPPLQESPVSPSAESISSRPGALSTSQDGLAAASRTGSVVVVLQELTWGAGSLDPLVMRIELSRATLLPLTRVTFHIPADRISPVPMVFWVRLFSDASIYLNICCSTELLIGNLEDVCSTLGYQVVVREGQADATLPATEQVFLRCPLSCKVSDNVDAEVNDPAGIMSFVFVESKSVSRCLSHVVHSSSTVDSYYTPRTQGSVIPVSNMTKYLIGRCYPVEEMTFVPSFRWKLLLLCQKNTLLNMDSIPQNVSNGSLEHRFVGAYTPNNRLVLFRDRVTVNKSSFPLAFRLTTSKLTKSALLAVTTAAPPSDVKPSSVSSKKPLTAPKSPAADVAAPNSLASGSLAGDSLTEGCDGCIDDDIGLDVKEDVWLVFRLINKYDRIVIAEHRGRSVLDVFEVMMDPFAVGAVSDETAATANKKAPAAGVKGKAAAVPVGEPLDMIIECLVDEKAMVIPEQWRCRLPYSFSQSVPGYVPPTFDGSLNEIPTPRPQFLWQLDYLRGSVMAVSHDTFDLERFTTQKNSWESLSEGRTERALAALTYYKSLINTYGTGCGTKSRSASPDPQVLTATLQHHQQSLNKELLLTSLATALSKTNPELTQRVDFLESTVPVNSYTIYRYVVKLLCEYICSVWNLWTILAKSTCIQRRKSRKIGRFAPRRNSPAKADVMTYSTL